MAVLGQITLDELAILSVDSDPAAASTVAPVGSIAMLDNSTNGIMWLKTGAANTAWSLIPRQPNATAYATGVIPFADASGNLTSDKTKLWFDATSYRLSLGANAPAAPQSSIHIDSGTGVASHVRFTAGTTTGQTSGDGTELGIDVAGNAEIRQYENSNINFLTNNTQVGTFAPGGQFLLGPTTTPIDITGAGALVQFQIIGTAAVQMAGIQYSADTIGPVFNILKSRGATVGTQGLLSASDEFGRIQFRGSDGANFQAGASIRAYVDGTAAANSMPGRLSFQTTPTASVTPVERVIIDATGQTIFSQNIRVGNGTDTTAGNIRYNGTEILGRTGGAWTVMAGASINLTSTATFSTTSGTYTTINDMTTTPAAGTYMALGSFQANGTGQIALHIAGVEQPATTRIQAGDGGLGATAGNEQGSLSFVTIITVNGSQVVDARGHSNSGTFTVTPGRQLILWPLSR